jgi:hypothetical protein
MASSKQSSVDTTIKSMDVALIAHLVTDRPIDGSGPDVIHSVFPIGFNELVLKPLPGGFS